MIGKLTGRITPLGDGLLLVEVGGVGYSVRAPLSALSSLPSQGSLYIHTAVREDSIDLYGFPDEEGLLFFRQLLSVSSIGPKTALSVMSVGDVLSLKRTIARGDAQALTKVFGVGKKSAERIVLELKDKLLVGSTPAAEGGDSEVIEALMALGYSAHECRKVLKDLGTDSEGSVQERLSAALRKLGTHA